MPIFVVNTNLPAEKIRLDFLKETSKVIAAELGKPESYVCVRVNAGQMMTFGGTPAPCALIELESLGVVSPKRNKELVVTIGEHIEKSLGIPQDRFYIKITDVPRSDLGFNGKTFA